MNKNIETIKVNNGQQLIQKAKEYKNSGGEWKLWEFYLEMPKGKNSKKRLNWGIVISDSRKKINICSLGEKGFSKSGVYDEVQVRDQLHQLFPRVAEGLFAGEEEKYDEHGGRPIQSRLDYATSKLLKENNTECWLYRYLVAESNWHLKKILNEYIQENKAKVYQSSNPHFSDWVEIIDGQDGNMYLYVGEKNDGGGREIKIGIKKEEFYSKNEHNFYAKSGGGYYSAEEMLKMAWNLFTINRPWTPAETREYYSSDGRLEEEWKRNWPHRRKLCRKYLEELRNRMTEKINYWQEKTRQKDYWNHEANEQGILANSHIAEIDNELADMKKNRLTYYDACDKNCSFCGIKLCCHYEGQVCSENKNRLFSDFHSNDCQISSLEKSDGSEKLQIFQYFITKNIKKITLDNGKLMIEYNSGTKKVVKNKDQQIQKCYQLIQSLPSQSLSLSELQKNSINNSHDSVLNKNNTVIYISLAISAFVLGGIFVYFLTRKKKKQ